MWLTLMTGISLLVIGPVLFYDDSNLQTFFIFAGISSILVAIVTGIIARLVYITKRKDQIIWIKGCKSEFSIHYRIIRIN